MCGNGLRQRKQIKALGLISAAAILAILAGCAKKTQPVYWTVTKQSTAQLRQNDIHVLRKKGVQVIKLGETMRLVFPSNQLFADDSANLKAMYLPVLKTTAHLLRTYEKVTVKVVAYSDDMPRGKGPKNRKQALTTRQGQVVARYLWSKGIDARLIYALGCKDAHPIASNDTAKGRACNRRVEVSFRFYPKFKPYD